MVTHHHERRLLPLVLIVSGLLLLGLYALRQERPSQPTTLLPPTSTPTPVPLATETPPAMTAATVTETAVPIPTQTPLPTPTSVPTETISFGERFGVGAAGGSKNIPAALAAGLPIGVYLTWTMDAEPPGSDEVVFWQMVTVTTEGVVPAWDEIAAVIDAQPGAVWIVGNEPDVIWQSNMTADRYAELYHDVYEFIKSHDPQAQIAVAGVAQPTPLRLAYLDRVLAVYEAEYGEPMPVDVWTVHAFVLREEAGSWGVDIPPGMDGDTGRLYDLSDHGDIAIFRQNLIDFRAWMAERGYADRPLAVTEFSVVMPIDFGFPTESTIEFMEQAFDFMLTEANETGYPSDGNRLVQWYFWYSLSDPNPDYAAANLFDSKTGVLTELGKAYAAYVNSRTSTQ